MDGIPIRNLYLLLCYALEQPPKAQEAWRDGEEGGGYLGLLARLLMSGTRLTLHRGLDRGHIPQRELLGSIRGRIDLGSTLSSLQHKKARLWCEFDDHLPNVLHNQILLATLRYLARDTRLPGELRHAMPGLLRRFTGITPVDLRAGLFREVHLGRQNGHYRLLMGLCELIFYSRIPDAREGVTRFLDFLRDQFGMAKIFEDFIRNFLKFHGPEADLTVLAQRAISWTFEPDPEWDPCRHGNLIPAMEADILVESTTGLTIVDAKFYEKTVRAKFGGSPKLYSSNLFQIQAYVEAMAQLGLAHSRKNLEGMLIYPTTDVIPPITYKLRGHHYHIRTIDLTRPWREIHETMLSFLRYHPVTI